MRRCIAAFILAGVFAITACSTPAVPLVPSLPAGAPLVAFYGDSYTLGTGASDPSKRWSTRVSESRGWREYNPSLNGLGFVALRDYLGVDAPAQIIAADPDIVIVTLGLNDAYSFESVGTRVQDQIREDFDRLSTQLPSARIIVVEPFWYTAERPEALIAVTEWVREEAEQIDADYIPGASEWIQGRDGEMASDGLHPNDNGYDIITRHMDEALRALGL